MTSTGFALTAFGAWVGYLSWKGGKDTKVLLDKMQATIDKIGVLIDEGNRRVEQQIAESRAQLQASIDDRHRQ